MRQCGIMTHASGRSREGSTKTDVANMKRVRGERMYESQARFGLGLRIAYSWFNRVPVKVELDEIIRPPSITRGCFPIIERK